MSIWETIRPTTEERINLRDDLSAGTNVTLHVLLLGRLAWGDRVSRFSSLSAYLLATGEKPHAEGASHVVVGHAVAAVAGLVASLIFAQDIVVEAFEDGVPFSSEVGRLSGIVSMLLRTIGMLWTDTNHSAACATTLIVALGLLSTLPEVVIIVVAILVSFHDLVVERVQDFYGVEPKDPR